MCVRGGRGWGEWPVLLHFSCCTVSESHTLWYLGHCYCLLPTMCSRLSRMGDMEYFNLHPFLRTPNSVLLGKLNKVWFDDALLTMYGEIRSG